ncbi:MAG: hypothetical protein ABI988_16455 [Nitrospirota bacterium]
MTTSKEALVTGGPTIGSDLLQRHFKTLVDDNTQWQALIADDIVWELACNLVLGCGGKLSLYRSQGVSLC